MALESRFVQEVRKYEIMRDQQIVVAGTTLYRVRALCDFGHVKAGSIGGYVRSESNLSQHGHCWIADDAQAYGEAVITDAAQVYGRARIYDRARICDRAQVLGNAEVFENGWVFKDGIVFDNAKVFGAAQVRDNGLAYGDSQIFDNVRVVNRGEVCGPARIGGRAVIDGHESGNRPRPASGAATRNRRPRSPRGPRLRP